LRAGTSREDLAAQVLAGPEYRTHALDVLYRRLLGRPPDGRELAEQLRRLERGEGLEHVEAGLLATEEYFRERAGWREAMFVIALYRDVLGRRTDRGSESFVHFVLQEGSTARVVREVFQSPEARRRRAEMLCRPFLDHPPDAATLDSYAQELLEGTTCEALVARALGSEAYFQQVQAAPEAGSTRDRRYATLVAKLCRQALGRPAEAAEVTYWTGRLTAAAEAGVRITAVLLELLNSPEALQALTATWRQRHLADPRPLAEIKRTADIAALTGGASFRQVLCEQLAGEEVYAAAGPTRAGLPR